MHSTRRFWLQQLLALGLAFGISSATATLARAECRVDVERPEVPAFTRCFLDVDANYVLLFAAPLAELGIPSQVEAEALAWLASLRAGGRRAYIEEDVDLPPDFPVSPVAYLVKVIGERRTIGEEELNEAEDLFFLAERELEDVFDIHPDPSLLADGGERLPAQFPSNAERLVRAQGWADQLSLAGYDIDPYPTDPDKSLDVSVVGLGEDLRNLKDDLGPVYGIWPQGDLDPAPSDGFAFLVQAQDGNSIVEIQDLTLDGEDQFMTGGYWQLFDMGTFPPEMVGPPFGDTLAVHDPAEHTATLDLGDSFYDVTMEFDVDKIIAPEQDVWVLRQTYNIENIQPISRTLRLYNIHWFRITGFGIRDEGWIEGNTLAQAASPGGWRELAVTTEALGSPPSERAIHPCDDLQAQGDPNCQFFGFYPEIGSGSWLDLSLAGSDWSLENKAGPSDLESGYQWGKTGEEIELAGFESFSVVVETYIYRTPRTAFAPWPKAALPVDVAQVFEHYLPEPASAIMQGLTLLTLGVYARRRRRLG